MKLGLPRRSFLAGAGSAIASPFVPKLGFAADTNVVIVGAGATGLGAARYLIEKGMNPKVFEANSRIRGRAWTENSTFGVPFDHGCTFQHIAHRNPWVDYAKANGFKIRKLSSDQLSRVHVGRREATSKQYRAMHSRYDAIRTAFAAAGRSANDISLQEAIKDVRRNKWTPIAEFWHRASFARELDDVSVHDWWAGAEGEDYYCSAGYGSLVSHLGKDVPVELDTRVTEIAWSGLGVAITTNRGRITARFCLLTVSVGVLASGLIRFVPELPEWKQAAFDGINMGKYVTIGLQFSKKRVLPVRDNVWFWVNGEHGELLEFMSNLGNHGVSRPNASGDLAASLEQAGREAAEVFALERLEAGLGSRIVKRFRRGSLSTWINDPLTLGTWAFAKPGKAGLRATLRTRVAKKLHFAGEACHGDMFATCHGAFISGQTAARQIAQKLT